LSQSLTLAPTQVSAGPRTISAIAREIRRTWTRPYFGAVPYLQAMQELSAPSDSYGQDSARSIVLYFLSNASMWRGDDAKRIKAELKALVSTGAESRRLNRSR